MKKKTFKQVKINVSTRDNYYILNGINRIAAETFIRNSYNAGFLIVPKDDNDIYIPTDRIVDIIVTEVDFKEIVNDFKETESHHLGWKETYNNALESYNKKEIYSEQLQNISKEELVDLKCFWEKDSIVKDFIGSVTVYTGDGNTGSLFIEFKY